MKPPPVRLPLILLLLGAGALAWAGALTLTDGFVVHLWGIRFASRNARNPLFFGLVSTTAAVLLATLDQRRLWIDRCRSLPRLIWTQIGRLVQSVPSQVAPALAFVAAVGLVTVTLDRGALMAGGADAYGYVSQADLWTRGELRIQEPLIRELDWRYAADALAPLGYRAAPDRTSIVPIYSPGLPLVMSLFQRVAGRQGAFYVVPLLAGLTVWVTYLLGVHLAGRLVGALAAILMATSPPFVFQAMLPMSDVPVAAWWAVSFVLLTSTRRATAFASGIAAGLAILTRPNLVPLGVVPAVWLLVAAIRAGSLRSRDAQRLVLFALGAMPGCAAVALVNAHLYGSPFTSGYGSLSVFFGWSNVVPNARNYSQWLLRAQTPIILLALAGPWAAARAGLMRDVARRRFATGIMWLCFALAVFVCFLPYDQFDNWFWLRFVLSALPLLLVLVSVTLVLLCSRAGPTLRVVLSTAIVAIVAWRSLVFLQREGAFRFDVNEHKTVAVGRYVQRSMPERAIFLSMQQSGSVRYYSGRMTVRWDCIEPSGLESAIVDLRRLGYHPYILLEEWEEEHFKRLFQRHTALGALDWPPVAILNHSTPVRIYDPADRGRPDAHLRIPDVFN